MWIVLFQYRLDHPDVYWTAVSLPGIALLATWAFAGHSTSMRWPTIGVVTDVAHHAAAAAWIAGLAIVGWIVIPRTTTEIMVRAVRNFSRVTASSVAVLVVTGLVQSRRLIGNPADVVDADHGRYLAVKIVVLVAMLLVANANRRRVDGRLDDTSTLEHHLGPLRQAIVAELAIGLVIIAVTAAMVVSPPSTSETESGAAAATLAACGSDDSSSADTTPADTTPADTTQAAVTEAPAGADASISLNAADIEFAQGMIAHHEGAVSQSETVTANGPTQTSCCSRIRSSPPNKARSLRCKPSSGADRSTDGCAVAAARPSVGQCCRVTREPANYYIVT